MKWIGRLVDVILGSGGSGLASCQSFHSFRVIFQRFGTSSPGGSRVPGFSRLRGGCDVAVRCSEVVVELRLVLVARSLFRLRYSACGPFGADAVVGGVDVARVCGLRSGSRLGLWLWNSVAFSTSAGLVVA